MRALFSVFSFATLQNFSASMAALLLVFFSCVSGGAQNSDGIKLGVAQPFSFAILTEKARNLAAAPFKAPKIPQAEQLERIDFDAHWKIRFNPAKTVRALENAPVQFFHLGRYFKEPVSVSLVKGGSAREVLYNENFFDVPDDSPARKLKPGAGFAGFRIMRPDLKTDWISFLGGSYFRTDGSQIQYGLSARGLAIDTGLSSPEEFPRFTEFYLAQDGGPEDDLTIYALLDSPSVAGAYRMRVRNGVTYEGAVAGFGSHGGQVMEVTSKLYFRKTVERLGVAPLTSMYWYSESNHLDAFDWRPEVHDSDGLAILTGAGEHIWRPLNNPGRVVTSSFMDDGVKGFGLIQRDRNFENYQDDGVFYDRRPSVWVEPMSDWGEGVVQLIEIPTDDEIYDNIVAYWSPHTLPVAGSELSFDYRLHWGASEPFGPKLARTFSTRVGHGGAPGQMREMDDVKIVIDFKGDVLKNLAADADVAPKVTVNGNSKVKNAFVLPVVGTDRWRLTFELEMGGENVADGEVIDVRAFLSSDGKPLSETWLGQVHKDHIMRK